MLRMRVSEQCDSMFVLSGNERGRCNEERCDSDGARPLFIPKQKRIGHASGAYLSSAEAVLAVHH